MRPGRFEQRGGFPDKVHHRAARGSHPANALDDFSGAGRRNHVMVVRVDGEGLQARPVLHRSLELFGKTCPVLFSA